MMMFSLSLLWNLNWKMKFNKMTVFMPASFFTPTSFKKLENF
jgi:hypothetical protein